MQLQRIIGHSSRTISFLIICARTYKVNSAFFEASKDIRIMRKDRHNLKPTVVFLHVAQIITWVKFPKPDQDSRWMTGIPDILGREM
jgi:hypothetical protein